MLVSFIRFSYPLFVAARRVKWEFLFFLAVFPTDTAWGFFSDSFTPGGVK